MGMWPVKRWVSAEAVQEPLDTPRMAEGNFLAVRTEGSGILGNICQSCASGLLSSSKVDTIYGSCNRGLGGVPYNSHLDISKEWGFSQYRGSYV